MGALVANAGTSYAMLTDKRYRELTTYDLDVVGQIFTVNTVGMWLCMRYALPALRGVNSALLPPR